MTAWPLDPLATVEQADAYATARGWADWSPLTPERKAGALLDASTYIKACYRPPVSASEAVDGQIADAAIEAARLSLTAPLIGGNAAGQRARKSVKAGSVAVEYDTGSAKDLSTARLALVMAMLRAVGVYLVGAGVNVRLSKS